MPRRELTCIICPLGCRMTVDLDDRGEITALEGNACERGGTYVRAEILSPTRILTALIRLEGGPQPMCPVKTSRPVPKDLIRPMARAIAGLSVRSPVRIGDVVIPNLLGTGADLVITRDLS